MSQRSHMAQSGSSAIIECSAACSVPSRRGISSTPSSIQSSGRYQTASVSNVVSGMSQGDEVERRLVADRLLLVGDDLLGDADAAEEDLHAEPALDDLGLLDRGHRLLLRLRVVVARERLDERGSALEVEGEHAVGLAHVQVDGALVHGRVGALPLDEAEDGARLGLDDGERLGARRAERKARRRIVPARPDVAGLRPLQLAALGERLGPLERSSPR